MKSKVAILAGHHGRGTGASYGERDEYSLARRDGITLYHALVLDDLTVPMLEPIERLDDPTPIHTAADWVNDSGADICLEIHYNALATPNLDVAGNLLLAPRNDSYAATMDHWLRTLPNRHLEPMIGGAFALFKLVRCPVVIIEAAFIWEQGIETDEWSAQVASALKAGLYDYLRIDKRGLWPNE